jgi:hypothetical protein
VDDLNKRVQDQVNQGSVKLSSDDFADFGTDEEHERAQEALTEDSTVPVPEEAQKDPLLGAADQALDNAFSGVDVDDPADEVTVTAEEKNVFLEAIVKGGRFELPFTIFGGNIRGVFRSRTNAETRAIYSQVHRKLVEEEILTTAEHSALIRNALLCCQLAVYGEVENPPMGERGSLMPKNEWNKEANKVEIIEPEWYEYMNQQFGEMDDGLVDAIYSALRNFERKYWVMVKQAEDQDFWDLEGSS